MKLYLLAGEFFNSDPDDEDPKHKENAEMLKNFEDITIDYSQNISFMKVPIIGSPEFIQVQNRGIRSNSGSAN